MAPLSPATYIMEDPREASRLALKVNPDAWIKKYLAPHLFSGAEVLSVGCGPGNITRAITKLHPKVNATGIDVSPARIQQAKEASYNNPRARFVCGDARQMKFASGG